MIRPGLTAVALALALGALVRAAAAACPGAAPVTVDDVDDCVADWITSCTGGTCATPVPLNNASIEALDDLAVLDAIIAEARARDVASAAGADAALIALESTAAARRKKVLRKLADAAYVRAGCGEDRVWCLDRDGNPLVPYEVEPQLFAGDRLAVLVLSYHAGDDGRISLGARTIRSAVTLFDGSRSVATSGGGTGATELAVVARIDPVVTADARRLEITVAREPDATGADELRPRTLTLDVELREHLVEFGLMLPFVYDRKVSGRGAVSYGLEPDLAFSITLFPGRRVTGEALQPGPGRWFGAVVAADLTSPVRSKRYYAGLDFSPVGGLALDLGLALIPWQFVPAPEDVLDVLPGDLTPVSRYRPSFFIGVRMTPEAFESARSAYEALRK